MVETDKLINQTVIHTPMIDHAENIDFTIMGVDEEKAEMAVRKLYDLD